ncbi:hypothetical protein QUB63_34560 [Microcoleus sp. ARI1-B5]|uniref:hypothetical protein n=1 Tax=unclassified Microcoleus TaxID=2642155 RepID=UPI002FD32E85
MPIIPFSSTLNAFESKLMLLEGVEALSGSFLVAVSRLLAVEVSVGEVLFDSTLSVVEAFAGDVVLGSILSIVDAVAGDVVLGSILSIVDVGSGAGKVLFDSI